FSSRRRHTRSLRDWSSDVCSSDLGIVHPPSQKNSHVSPALDRIALKALSKDVGERYATASEFSMDLHRFMQEKKIAYSSQELARSEERRVGKECRSRWTAGQ